jgi:VCBS repeat-containing protein
MLATYSGDTNYSGSSGALSQVVTQAVLTVTADNQTMLQGGALPALTYTMTGFVNGDTQAGATTGQPSLSTTATSSSPAGAYPITITPGTLAAANYSFTFANGTLTITPLGTFSISAASPSETVGAGETATYTITVISRDGFTGPVSFVVSGVPVDAPYNFAPATVTLTAGGTAQTTLKITTTSRDGSRMTGVVTKPWGGRRVPDVTASAGLFHSSMVQLGLILFGFAVCIPGRRKHFWKRRMVRMVRLFALMVLAVGLLSCGSHSQTYTITISGTANAYPAITSSTTVTLGVN